MRWRSIMVGDSFGGYRILSRLGQGRSGTVYRARRESDGRCFSLKIVHPEMSAGDAGRAELLAAAALAGRLAHPGIAGIVEVLDSPAAVGIVSELAEGTPLSDRLLSGPMTGPEVARVAAVVARAVAHAHERGLAGLAIDPANVLIGAKGDPTWTGLDSVCGADSALQSRRRLEDIGELVSLLRRMARGCTDLPDGLRRVLQEDSYRTAAALAEDLAASVAPAGRAWPRSAAPAGSRSRFPA